MEAHVYQVCGMCSLGAQILKKRKHSDDSKGPLIIVLLENFQMWQLLGTRLMQQL